MFNFQAISVHNPEWKMYVKKSSLYDFHHTQFYNEIDNDFDPVMFVAEDGDDFIALPLVKRPIKGTSWFDFTSVYGYCGPITNRESFDFTNEFKDFFWSNFKDYCKENNIVSIFSRLHPLIYQAPLFIGVGEVLPLNKTVAIDLRLTPDEQKRQYRKSNKSELNQLRRKGFYVEEAQSLDDIDRFVEIYYETMDRVKASSSYYFSKEYFHSFLKNKQFRNKLLLTKFENQIIAGAVFTITNKIMQYHLAGTSEAFIKETPMKLILDEARLKGNELGLEYLHLGGGVGGSDEDSLFRFKSGFSDLYCQFSVWRYIFDEVKYNELVKENVALENLKSNFFPLYRL